MMRDIEAWIGARQAEDAARAAYARMVQAATVADDVYATAEDAWTASDVANALAGAAYECLQAARLWVEEWATISGADIDEAMDLVELADNMLGDAMEASDVWARTALARS